MDSLFVIHMILKCLKVAKSASECLVPSTNMFSAGRAEIRGRRSVEDDHS